MNIDWEVINSYNTPGDPNEDQWLNEFITMLIEEVESQLIQLSQIIDNPEDNKLVSKLHEIKGVTANAGLLPIWKITETAESFAKSKKIEECKIEIEKIKPIWEETKLELIQKLEK